MNDINLNLPRFETMLGYQFANKDLLYQALSHRSYSEKNNERLEFLGDSIINFLVGEKLYLEFPNEPEGKLSRLRAHLVKQQTLYEVGHSLKISDYILLGAGELRAGGHKRQSLIADCVEALIAAIFLDCQSMNLCREHVLPWFKEKFADIDNIEHLKDPKTRLQECMQSRHLSLPVYKIIHVKGEAHNLHFEVECQAPMLEKHKIVGQGESRRKAEQDAAQYALDVLNDVVEDCNC